MKLLALMAVAVVTLSACGSPSRWESLPVMVAPPSDAMLLKATEEAIAILNAGLGHEALVIGEGAVTVERTTDCINGTCFGTATHSGGLFMDSCVVKVMRTEESEFSVLLIAHELFHCLGFSNDDHSTVTESIFIATDIASDAVVDAWMLELFQDRYPEVTDGDEGTAVSQRVFH